jgi:8-oxo-dGTP pyrophosphatase MutT (NUDIX family)
MREIRELSAGGIVYRRIGGAIEVALIRTGKRWGLPKGHVEDGESLQQAACREVFEETGLEGEVIEKLGDISYRYTNKRTAGEPVRVLKRVHFYLLRWTRGEVHGHDYEVDEARWFPLADALAQLSYPTEKKMMQRAIDIITRNESRPVAGADNEPPPHAEGDQR